jgi:diaminohydroxyphosphoribosylaminopyrimidine deaminase/5-amino-6-(5-phosphoribosylamino)uracil reductase
MKEKRYMRQALWLAEKGRGKVNPNPLVGAVIVREGKVVGEGYHGYYGGPHAERVALEQAGELAKGATLYVTLEPCCHYGKTPPCTEAILESGIRKVVAATMDPNPLVAGRGIARLSENGVEVSVGMLKEQSEELNRVFNHYMITGRPLVRMKYAMTMDGKIATASGKSRWITGEPARRKVHESRSEFAGIMVGSGTVQSDDPLLTCRLEHGQNPMRVICDSRLSIDPEAQIVRTAREVPTYLAYCHAEESKCKRLRESGVHLIKVAEEDGRVDLGELLPLLGKQGIDSLLLEGGASLNESMLRAGLVDQIHLYLAPKVWGGATAKTPVGGLGIDDPEKGYGFKLQDVERIGEDLLLTYERNDHVYWNH